MSVLMTLVVPCEKWSGFTSQSESTSLQITAHLAVRTDALH